MRLYTCLVLFHGWGGGRGRGLGREKRFDSRAWEILILSVVDETRDRGKRVTREGGGGKGFSTPIVSTTTTPPTQSLSRI